MSVSERRNGKSSVTEYTVSPARADVAHRWLRVTRKASESATMSGNVQLKLPLGNTHHEDGGPLHIVSGGLEYQPGGRYEFAAYMVDGSCDEMRQGALGAVLGLGGRRAAVMDFDLRRRGRDEGLPGIEAVGRNLRERLAGDYELGEPEKKEIFITAGTLFTDAEPLVVRSVESPDGQNGYALELKRGIEEDPEEFAKRFNAVGRVLQELVRAVYEERRRPSPAETLDLGPEEGTEEGVRRLEQQLEISKRQMRMMGLTDEEDDSEIERSIIAERPTTRFVHVGGQTRAKIELSDVVAGLRDPQEFWDEAAEPPSGVLLYGPPGTGKTLLARATAGEAGVPIFVVSLASMLHSLWGQTEKRLQRVFDKAREVAPSMLFLDEIDSVARQRSALDRGYSSIVRALQENMDGFRERPADVVVIGATNYLDMVDEALLRPGRFDMLVKVDKPNAADIADILGIHRGLAMARTTRPEAEIFDSAFDSMRFAREAERMGFSGADVEELLRRGLVERVRIKRRGDNPGPLTADNLIAQIAVYEDVRKDKSKIRSSMDISEQWRRRTEGSTQ